VTGETDDNRMPSNFKILKFKIQKKIQNFKFKKNLKILNFLIKNSFC